MSRPEHPITAPTFKLDPQFSGIELARQWMQVQWPGGYPNRLPARPVEVGEGYMKLVCELDAGHSNFVGLVHGGVTAGLVDFVGGGAAMTILKAGEYLLTTDLQMRFLNGAPIDCGQLIAEGHVSYADDRKVITDVKIMTPDDVVVVLGTVAIARRVRK